MNLTLAIASELVHPDYKHVLEFGVFKGGTLRQLRKDFDQSYSIYGFDSFTGLPEDWQGTKVKKEAFDLKGQIPKIEHTTIFAGWFTDSIPEYKKVAQPIALLHIDCDLYSSTIDILYGLKEYIKPGTVLVFDEWYYNHEDIPENRQHEQKAFFEWAKEFDVKYKIVRQFEDERRIVKIL